jgi:hypothetical protein
MLIKLNNAHRWKFVKHQTVNWLSQLNYIENFKDSHDDFLAEMISMMGTLFSSPETEIIKQGEKAFSMYFIVSGTCLTV